MLFKRNLLETMSILTSSGTIICIILNYLTNISPITGIWLMTYLLFLFIASVFCSFKFIQWLLHQNEPIKYNLDNIVQKYPFLSCVTSFLPHINRGTKTEPIKEYDTNELSIITTVLERKLVSSWYVTYISEEIGFPFACKQMLDQMIAKTFQICNKIETKDVYVDICAIVISHLKEYKKAIKRHEATPDCSIENSYKKTHPIFNNNNKKMSSADHCINILRIILKDLVPWELWDTPYSELLVRILAKKLDIFIDTTIIDPIWLNDRLLTILLTKENDKSDINNEKPEKSEVEVQEKPQEPNINNDSVTLQAQKNITEENENKKDDSQILPNESKPVEIKPVLRQKRGRQERNEVKIYDRIIEGSVKTWETDMDLQCISVGQDLLASLDEMTLSRLWGHEDVDHSPNLRASPPPLWFGEEDTIDLEEEKKSSSPNPTDALLKDLQTTVNQAKTKIGDLQVLHVDVKQSDEAAGMMEGLLDKGIAGIKKGLRFTGLSDDSQEKSPAHKEKSTEKISPTEMFKSKSKPETVIEAKESYVPTLQKEENGGSAPQLIKQRNITSQDSMQLSKQKVEYGAPADLLSESPEPQYEEAADLSASIAKLRSLLQHTGPSVQGNLKPHCLPEQQNDNNLNITIPGVGSPSAALSSVPRRAEEVWWEGAEETRGRTTLRPSSRPVDTAALADEYDMNMDRNSSPGQTSNNMQRLDKLFQRTVTGVFNSLKTAVGAEGTEAPGGVGGAGGAGRETLQWTYVPTAPDLAVCARAGRLVCARRALWQVDAALDSLNDLSADAPAAAAAAPLDLEEWCSAAGARWAGAGGAGAAAGLLRAHLAFRLATVLGADIAESLITSWLEDLTVWLRKQIFAYFEKLSVSPPEETPGLHSPRHLCVEETCSVVMERIPETYLFSEHTLSEAVKLVITSLTHKEINKDIIYRAIDIFTMHFKKSAVLRNPSFDNN